MKFHCLAKAIFTTVLISGSMAFGSWTDSFDSYGNWASIASNWSVSVSMQTDSGQHCYGGSPAEWGVYGYAFRAASDGDSCVTAKLYADVPSTGNGGGVWQDSVATISMSKSTEADSAGRIAHMYSSSINNVLLSLEGGLKDNPADSILRLTTFDASSNPIEVSVQGLLQETWYDVKMILSGGQVSAFYKLSSTETWTLLGSVTPPGQSAANPFAYNYVGISNVRNALIDDVATSVPEPATIALLSLSALFAMRKK